MGKGKASAPTLAVAVQPRRTASTAVLTAKRKKQVPKSRANAGIRVAPEGSLKRGASRFAANTGRDIKRALNHSLEDAARARKPIGAGFSPSRPAPTQFGSLARLRPRLRSRCAG